jgi:hypothetical protein
MNLPWMHSSEDPFTSTPTSRNDETKAQLEEELEREVTIKARDILHLLSAAEIYYQTLYGAIQQMKGRSRGESGVVGGAMRAMQPHQVIKLGLNLEALTQAFLDAGITLGGSRTEPVQYVLDEDRPDESR